MVDVVKIYRLARAIEKLEYSHAVYNCEVVYLARMIRKEVEKEALQKLHIHECGEP